MTLSLAPERQATELRATAVLSPRSSRAGREAANSDLATRHLQGVSSLLQTRADLRGVHAFADIVEESVRWSA